MKKLLFVLLLLFFIKPSFAQTKDTILLFKKNATYLEIWGNAVNCNYSINYERIILSRGYNKLALRIGFAERNEFDLIDFPILLNYFIGHFNHFEIGGGVYLETGMNKLTNKFDEINYIPTTSIGYRYQKPNGKFLFRIAYTPTFYQPSTIAFSYYLLRFGASLGYCF